MADLMPTIIVAIGAAALGGPDALRFLLSFAGHSPAVDIFICVFAIVVATSAVLGAMLLVRHLRVRRRVPRNAFPFAEEAFPRMVRIVVFSVAFFVAACLLVAQGRGNLDAGQFVCSASR